MAEYLSDHLWLVGLVLSALFIFVLTLIVNALVKKITGITISDREVAQNEDYGNYDIE